MDVMEALRWMRWELESYAAYGDFVALPFFVMLFLDRFLLETLAMQLIPRKVHGNFSTENERRRKINKFKESAWKSVYFLSGESLFLPVTYSEPWFTKYQILMDRTRRSGLARSENKAVYTYAAAFYASSIFALCSGKQDNPISMCQCLSFSNFGSYSAVLHTQFCSCWFSRFRQT
ncbi:ASC1-like protein 1 isoform X2 [Musa acuminata AAA Group]|uniref:ASC1-like protein 1 isoform X2 n=1 Tax=Musa acuminata AAA Group TaxID=214697 RepID=UPI0031DD6534